MQNQRKQGAMRAKISNIYITARSFSTTPRNEIIIKWPPGFLIQVQLKRKFVILLLASFVTIWQKMGKFGESFKNHGAFGAP